MNKYAFLCLLSGVLTVCYSANAQSVKSVAATQEAGAAPSQAYSQVASEIADLMRRATVLSDDKALTLLRKESPTLIARAGKVKPLYVRWLKTLSPAEIRAEEKRLSGSSWGKYFTNLENSLESAPIGAKVSRNRAIAEYVMSLMTIFNGV
ncbi:DUF2059 domain-containing protein [Hymenobacter puniceus]|uniref:hypothetical protein n=1 Tax=Hymenobacter sp. BT190 TaxID=2763505 RepID=UPI001651796E|nr:hypothetical protein [Hymenobacter sp. BT190]MBC6696971.1 hypothetical protein [Hymenobacter sp. BT190]